MQGDTSAALGSALPLPREAHFQSSILLSRSTYSGLDDRRCLTSLAVEFPPLLLVFLYFGGDFGEEERGEHIFVILKPSV